MYIHYLVKIPHESPASHGENFERVLKRFWSAESKSNQIQSIELIVDVYSLGFGVKMVIPVPV